MNYNSRGRGFRPSGQSTHQAAQGQGTENPSREKEEVVACQICASEDLPRALPSINLNDPKIGDNAVYVDSGASTHMTNSSGKLSNLKPYKGTDKIVVGNGSELNITRIGSGSVSGLKLNEVFVVPELKKKLLSVSKLTKDNYCTIEFDESTLEVKDKVTGKQLAKRSRRGESKTTIDDLPSQESDSSEHLPADILLDELAPEEPQQYTEELSPSTSSASMENSSNDSPNEAQDAAVIQTQLYKDEQ
ncbi:hypothetical protein KY289_001986 [Solanum tuberosum]|nr:hypothetical protein KY289_001986 [Solanum tuberosum]